MPDLHDWGTGAAPKPPRPDYVPKWQVEPLTLDGLLQRAGPYANGTKTHVEWGAVTAWMMKGAAKSALASAFIPGDAASLSVFLISEAAEREAGWPQLSSRAVTPALYDLPEDAQAIARRMAAEVYALWETAGRPCLNTQRYKDAFRFLVACIRSGSIPPQRTIGDASPSKS